MLKSCNVLVAQTSIDEKSMDYIRKEAAKGDVEIRDMKKALSVREVQKCLKETENGEPKYTVLIIQQQLDQSKELVPAEELKKMRMMVPMLRILLCVSKDMAGSTYLQQVFEAGVYTAFYEDDGTMKNIVDLIRNGRSAKNAIAYYQISEDNPETRKQIGYIEEERLKKLLTLIHNAKDAEIDDVLNHIRKMLEKKEILFLIRNMIEDDVERVFFRKGMGLYFNQEKYKQDLEAQESGGLLKRFRKTELCISDYILEPDELDARIELVKIKRKAKMNKEQEALAKQVSHIEEDMKLEEKREKDISKAEKETAEQRTETIADQPAPEEDEKDSVPEQEDAGTDVTENPVEPEKVSSESISTEEVETIPEAVPSVSETDTAKTGIEPTEEERVAALHTLFGDNIDAGTATALLKALQQNAAPAKQNEEHEKKETVITEEKEPEDGINISAESELSTEDTDTTDVDIDLEDIPEDTSVVEDEETPENDLERDTEQESVSVPHKDIANKDPGDNEIPSESTDEDSLLEIDLDEEETEEEAAQKRKEELAQLAKTPLVLSSLTIRDENVKTGKLYYVISGGKHSGATTMSCVLAYTYKQKHNDKKVCVCSYDGNIDDYANLIDEDLGEDALDREAGKLTYKGVDFFIAKRSEILGLRREYDAVFVDMKGIGQFNKNYRQETVYLVTQGSSPQIKGLRKTIEKVKEIGFSDVSIVASVNKFNEEQEKDVRQLLDCPLYNIGFLHSATKHCMELRNAF